MEVDARNIRGLIVVVADSCISAAVCAYGSARARPVRQDSSKSTSPSPNLTFDSLPTAPETLPVSPALPSTLASTGLHSLSR